MKKARGSGSMPATCAPWQIVMTADDDSLRPVIDNGADVIVDCSDRKLVDGGIYAIREDNELKLWLFHEGFAGQGALISARKIGTLSSLAGSFRCRGPVLLEKILVVGRVVDTTTTAPVAARVITSLQAQRAELVSALEEARSALRRISGTIPAVDLAEQNGSGSSIAKLTRRFEEAMQDEAFARRFALEQKMDAIGSRLMHLEERIADAEVEDASGVLTKLQVLWDLHYAPFPSLQGDLGARFISSALRGLGRLSPTGADLGSDPRSGDDSPPARPIQLVTSPRLR